MKSGTVDNSKRSTTIKRIIASVAAGIILTIAIGGLKFYVFDKPGFNPRASCNALEAQATALCDPSPYLKIGFPWAYGMYSDASGSTRVLNFSDSSEYEGANVSGDYVGLLADIGFYSVVVFGLLAVFAKTRRTK
jgi:hypothetical protein